MTPDPRTTLALADRAAKRLEGTVRAKRFVDVKTLAMSAPNAPLRAAPEADAEQVSQILFGERFDVLDTRDGFAFGQAQRDGYVGWTALDVLAEPVAAPTHWVKVLRTAAFATVSIKSQVRGLLGLNALGAVVETADGMARLAGAGWVPERHLAPIGLDVIEAAAAAEMFAGAPYVWGGRDSLGLDCSGLVQQALHASGRACPRDADQQATLGKGVDFEDLSRGDLVFWRGHVGMMLDDTRLIHANAHHMAVAIEPLATAVARIAEKGAGEPTACRRIAP